MMNERGRVLVIDDDEVVLVAITDMLEAAHYKVYSQASPIGATSVIAAEGIDLAIIDLNLPVLQGDSVVRLLRGWDKLQDLPLILVSGDGNEKLAQLQSELRNVRSVKKSEMHQLLVKTVEQLLAFRPPPSTTVARPHAPRETELRSRFVEQVSNQLKGAALAYSQIRDGELEAQASLLRSLSVLRGQAHLLGMAQASRLLDTLYTVIEALRPGRRWPPEVDGAVGDALRALLGLKHGGDFLLSPEPLIEGLSRAATKLRPGQPLRQ
jgi:CheY-like chemotaxis protein